MGKILRKYYANFGKLLEQFRQISRKLRKSWRNFKNIRKLFAKSVKRHKKLVKFLYKFIND